MDMHKYTLGDVSWPGRRKQTHTREYKLALTRIPTNQAKYGGGEGNRMGLQTSSARSFCGRVDLAIMGPNAAKGIV